MEKTKWLTGFQADVFGKAVVVFTNNSNSNHNEIHAQLLIAQLQGASVYG